MGFTYNGTTEATAQTQRARLAVTMSGEADNGLSFGAFFRATAGAADVGAADVFISGVFGKIAFGNNDDAVVTLIHNTPHLGVLEADGGSRRTATVGVGAAAAIATNANILYTYSVGDIRVAASSGVNTSDYTVAARFALGDASVAIGQARVGTNTQTTLSGAASLAGVNLVAFTQSRTGSTTETGLSAAYTMDATTITLRAKNDFASVNHLGLGVNYNLGGGAVLGASLNRVGTANANASAGVSFRF